MNKVSSSRNATVLVTALILVVLIAMYYYVIMPKKDAVAAMEIVVVNLQSEMTDLQANIANSKSALDKDTINDFALRKRLPQNRNMVDLLQNIEEIEFVSDSRILSISFNNYDALVAESQIQDPNETQSSDNENTNSEEVVSESQTEENTMPVSTISKQSLPDELKIVTFSMDMQAPNKSKLEQFIKEIEALERVMHIDTIKFSLPGEENEFAEDSSDIVFATIQVTTFYYDGK